MKTKTLIIIGVLTVLWFTELLLMIDSNGNLHLFSTHVAFGVIAGCTLLWWYGERTKDE